MSEKTEYPTAKKLRQAREDGQVAHSRDFTQTVLFLALFGYLLASAPDTVRTLGQMMLMPLDLMRTPIGDATDILTDRLVQAAVGVVLPCLGIVIGLGLFVEMLQTGMLFAFKAMLPSAKKLNVIGNLKNLFAAKSLIEVLKSVLKIVFLAALIQTLIRNELAQLLTLPRAGLAGVGVALGLLLKDMLLKVSVVYAIIAAADFLYQRHHHLKNLMMSKDEIKQEYKEMEGSPEIRQQRKHLHQELLQQGAVQRTRKASVVVTNPTHLAVAVLYDQATTPLPMVVAKGEGALARRMVEAAIEAGVPVLQNIDLAHALHHTAALDQYIPSELVQPVAEVLRLVRQLKLQESDPQ